MIDRRAFLAGLGATAAVAAAPVAFAAEAMPVLYCDGVHDDAPALQALFDGRPLHLSDYVTPGSVWRDRRRVVSGDLRNLVLRETVQIRPDEIGGVTFGTLHVVELPESGIGLQVERGVAVVGHSLIYAPRAPVPTALIPGGSLIESVVIPW